MADCIRRIYPDKLVRIINVLQFTVIANGGKLISLERSRGIMKYFDNIFDGMVRWYMRRIIQCEIGEITIEM